MCKNVKKIFILVFCFTIVVCHYAQAQTIAVYGDSLNDRGIHQKIVAQIIKFKPAAVFYTGDFCDGGDTKSYEWQQFVAIISQILKIADFNPALGNHDQPFRNSFQQFVTPSKATWYSVDINAMHCIVLDSTADLTDLSPQGQWFQSDLSAAAENKKRIIVFLHHPPFSVGKHTDEQGLQSTLVPLCAKYKVAMVFSGHNHAYERALYGGTYYIVTGGAGARLYEKKRKNVFNQVYRMTHNFCILTLRDNSLILNTYDDAGSLIDELTLETQK